MQNKILGFIILMAVLLFNGCGIKKECALEKNKKSTFKEEKKQNKKIYLGE